MEVKEGLKFLQKMLADRKFDDETQELFVNPRTGNLEITSKKVKPGPSVNEL